MCVLIWSLIWNWAMTCTDFFLNYQKCLCSANKSTKLAQCNANQLNMIEMKMWKSNSMLNREKKTKQTHALNVAYKTIAASFRMVNSFSFVCCLTSSCCVPCKAISLHSFRTMHISLLSSREMNLNWSFYPVRMCAMLSKHT